MPGTPSPRPPSSLQRRVAAAFTEQTLLKVTALALAVGLWFIVNVIKEPQSEVVPVRLIATLDSSLVLRDPLPRIEALVAGSPKELIKLNSSPPIIRRQISSDAPDTLVIDLGAGDVTLPEGVDAVVQQVEPRSLTLRFESTWTRRVPVRSAIDVSGEYGPPGPVGTRIDPSSVEVTGPRLLVARIPFVRTTRTTITLPDSLPHLVELDTTGLGPGVRVRPTQVKVFLTLLAHR